MVDQTVRQSDPWSGAASAADGGSRAGRMKWSLDILMHLPRESHEELNTSMQRLWGIETIPYNGPLGHKYFVNNVAQLVAQNRGWVVLEYEVVTVGAEELLLNFLELGKACMRYNCPPPTQILAIRLQDFQSPGCTWNRRVGWAHAQMEYNIHFLCTSNLAPPLEMLDGIVAQLSACQMEGIWAWDCVLGEMVLLLIWILVLLGDNPMQSELACHCGLLAKFFCWCCWVKGPDAVEQDVPGRRQHMGKEGPMRGCKSVWARRLVPQGVLWRNQEGILLPLGGGKKWSHRNRLESMGDMILRVNWFMGGGGGGGVLTDLWPPLRKGSHMKKAGEDEAVGIFVDELDGSEGGHGSEEDYNYVNYLSVVQYRLQQLQNLSPLGLGFPVVSYMDLDEEEETRYLRRLCTVLRQRMCVPRKIKKKEGKENCLVL
ncbi:hypothetical protein JB92DRAFT_3102105 [Gautieria morchelliformis]|nr:hypothetical protein JB92DRAFT_3102105 [Gautieria morchelliformis]